MTTEERKPVSRSASTPAAPSESTIEGSIEQAKRAYALKNFEQAVEHYATALELMTNKHGDNSPECVDLYFAYGKALLENAIAQSSVLGKEETAAAFEGDDKENKASGSGRNASGARIHFAEDSVGESSEDAGGTGEELTVDLFAEATKAELEEEGERENGEEDEDEDAEPEDDFNAAWEILEVARSLYEVQKGSSDEVKLKLADTFIALGDVSLETEKLEQAVNDYTAAVSLKTDLLPLSSRQIAEVHYKLCIVYDMTAGRLAHAIEHARKAEASVQARLDEITAQLKVISLKGDPKPEAQTDVKGKGKASSTGISSEPAIEDMTRAQLESEIKELEGLLEDVSLKIEELKTSPDTAEASAPDLVARELDRDLNASAANGPGHKQVNDLTSIVKKKKKASGSSELKRKADDEVDNGGSPEKKVRVDTSESV